MTYQEFRDKYNGKYVDYDGAYGNQCWDLAQYYFTEVLDVPDSVLSGCGLVSNMLYPPKRNDLDKYFDEVDVYHMNIGDVAIWTAGHIAILDHYDGANWWFSQNPGPCVVKRIDGLSEYKVFRRKQDAPTPPTPPAPVITPNVERDETKDQIEVLDGITELRVRDGASLDSSVLGYANSGYYNYLETKDNDGYKWYRISNSNWIASSDEWTKVYPKKEDEYVNIKVLENDGNYSKLDLNDIYIKR